MIDMMKRTVCGHKVMLDKKNLRKQAGAIRNGLSRDERKLFSQAVIERFVEQPFFVEHGVFFIYCNYLSEVETDILMRLCLGAGKRLGVPLTKKTNTGQVDICAINITNPASELAPGYCGIPEPLLLSRAKENSGLPEARKTTVPLSAPAWQADWASDPMQKKLDPKGIEVAVLPGLAFDRRGYRLGYGGGCYDRFLSRYAPQALRVGLAFSCQLVETLPTEAHDVPLHFLVTEKEILSWQDKG